MPLVPFAQFISEATKKPEFHKDLVVYHGTSHKFDQFDDDHAKAKQHAHTPAHEINGHFFTSDPLAAHSYASRSAKATGNKPRVLAAHLHMENPYNASKDIKKHQKAGASFSEAKRKAYSAVDRSKHDGVWHDGGSANHSEFVAFHGKHVKKIDE